MKKIHKVMLYLDTLEQSVYTSAIRIEDLEVPPDFNEQYVRFIENTPKR
jgi:hypothetical protein